MTATKNIGRKKRAVRLGPLLDGILARMGLAHKLGGWKIVTKWSEIVGDSIADVSQAVRFDDDTLLVSVPDAVWRQELLMQTDNILKKIHALPGGRAVKRIHFVS